MIVFTKKEETVVYNQQGKVHGSSPVRGAVMPLEVSTAFRDVPERGRCYQILSSGAFIRVDDVVADTTPNPPPVEPPPATKPADVDIVLSKGSTVTVKDTSGNTVFTYSVP